MYAHIWLEPQTSYKIASQQAFPNNNLNAAPQMVADFNERGKLLGIRIDLTQWGNELPKIKTITEEEYKKINPKNTELIPTNPQTLLSYLQDSKEEAIDRIMPEMGGMVSFTMGQGGPQPTNEHKKHLKNMAKGLVPVKRRYKIINPSNVFLAANDQSEIPQPLIGEPIYFVSESATICSAIKIPLHNWDMAKPRVAVITEHLFHNPCIKPGDPLPDSAELLVRYNEENIMSDDPTPPEAAAVI